MGFSLFLLGGMAVCTRYVLRVDRYAPMWDVNDLHEHLENKCHTVILDRCCCSTGYRLWKIYADCTSTAREPAISVCAYDTAVSLTL